MGEVIGPCKTLPGYGYTLPKGTKCDLHPNRLAVARIQGETDSMGAELNDMCQRCLDEHREQIRNEDTSGRCDWCGKDAPRRFNCRDYEEGMSGRLYQVCSPCIDRQNEEARRELEDRGYYDYDRDDYDD